MKIEHIALYVNNLEGARDFFIRYFDAISNHGYPNKTTDFSSHFLTFDDGTRLEIMTRPHLSDPEKSPFRTGFIHLHSESEAVRL